MDTDLRVKLEVYGSTAERGRVPTLAEVANRVGLVPADVRASFARIAARRLLVLEPDGETIRMAPPFSGVPTQHVAVVAGKRYFANCAWDVFGIIAALKQTGLVESRCEQTREPLRLTIRAEPDGLESPPSGWLFHCAVPAAHWWDDIVLT